MRRWALPVVCAVVALAGADTAAAQDSLVRGGPLAAGPRLAGGGIIRLVDRGPAAFGIDRVDTAGNPMAPPVLVSRGGELVGWDASSSVGLVDQALFGGGGKYGLDRLFENLNLVPAAGGVERLLQCSGSPSDHPVGFAADGERIAYVRNSCSSFPPVDVVVRDLAIGSESVVQVNRSVEHVALAGDYLAVGGPLYSQLKSPASYQDGSSEYVAVYDWRSGGLLHYTEPRGSDNRPLTITGFDVQDDAKVVLTHGSEDGCPAVYWFQTGDPAEHRLPICSSASILGSGIKIAGDRIVAPAENPKAQTFRGRWDLVASDLQGDVVKVATGFTAPPAEFRSDVGSAFDFDGTHVAVAAGNCDEAKDSIQLLDLEPPVADLSAGERPCPVRIVRKSVWMTRAGTVTFDVVCPDGCRLVQGQLMLNGSIMAGRRFYTGRMRAGERRWFGIGLKPRRIRRVKREGSLRLDIRLYEPGSSGRSGHYALLRGAVVRWPPPP